MLVARCSIRLSPALCHMVQAMPRKISRPEQRRDDVAGAVQPGRKRRFEDVDGDMAAEPVAQRHAAEDDQHQAHLFEMSCAPLSGWPK